MKHCHRFDRFPPWPARLAAVSTSPAHNLRYFLMIKIFLAVVAALSVLSASAAHAGPKLPKNDPLLGFWCQGDENFLTKGDGNEDCGVDDHIMISRNGIAGHEVRCPFIKLKQIRNGWRMTVNCRVNKEDPPDIQTNEHRVIDGRLYIR